MELILGANKYPNQFGALYGWQFGLVCLVFLGAFVTVTYVVGRRWERRRRNGGALYRPDERGVMRRVE